MRLLITYYQPPFGWLSRVRSDDDLYELYAVSTCNIVHNASINELVVEGRRFWYTGPKFGMHEQPKTYQDQSGWFAYDFMSGKIAQEEKLVNWLFRLGWQIKEIDVELYPFVKDPRKRKLPLGCLSLVAQGLV